MATMSLITFSKAMTHLALTSLPTWIQTLWDGWHLGFFNDLIGQIVDKVNPTTLRDNGPNNDNRLNYGYNVTNYFL